MSAQIQRSAMDALWECRRAWARQDQQTSFDFGALSGETDPRLSHGLSTEGVGTTTDANRHGGPACASLTAAAQSVRAGHGGPSSGASAPSLTKQGEA